MSEMFTEYEDLLTVDEACEALRLGHNMTYALLKRGELKGYRCGSLADTEGGAGGVCTWAE